MAFGQDKSPLLCPRGKGRGWAVLTKEPQGPGTPPPPHLKGERSPSGSSGQSRSGKGLLIPNVIYSLANAGSPASGQLPSAATPGLRSQLAAKPGAISWWRFMLIV